MANQDDVRRIALSLPETTEHSDEFRFFVDDRAFAWSWLERIDPKRARVPNPDGYPAVLVRLAAIDLDLLQVVVTDAWRCRAPKRLLSKPQ